MNQTEVIYPPVSYQTNSAGEVVHINDAWLSFARENDWPIEINAILGQPIWRYIEHNEVKHLYRLLMDKAQRSHTTLKLPYRCDSPGARRYMQMELSFDQQQKHFNFDNLFLRIEKRVPLKLLDPKSHRNKTSLTICSWCKQVNIKENIWEEVEQAVTSLELFSVNKFPQLSHGVCPTCRLNMLKV